MYIDAIHSFKMSGNVGTESNGTDIFRKFRFENFGQPREVDVFPGNSEILKISVPFGISTCFKKLIFAIQVMDFMT